MNSLILNAETANLPIAVLLNQVGSGGVELRDPQGNVVAFVLSPADHQAWTYAEANRDLDGHREEIRQALERRGGVTTEQLLKNAASATQDAGQR
jgi:hypothetical protein